MIIEILNILLRPVLPPPITRSCTAEFGPTPAVQYPQLLMFTDAQLLAHDRHNLITTAAAADEGMFRTEVTTGIHA